MAHKRPAADAIEPPSHKRVKRGFIVGPQNLPDGTHKRKVDMIRRKLVDNAKIKKSYDKLKAREEKEQTGGTMSATSKDQSTQITRHPERQALVDQVGVADGVASNEESGHAHGNSGIAARPSRRSKQPVYRREQRAADSKAKELDRRKEAADLAIIERDRRLAQRERWRRTMANARGDGRRRKLGKESTVLLEKIKRDMEREDKSH